MLCTLYSSCPVAIWFRRKFKSWSQLKGLFKVDVREIWPSKYSTSIWCDPNSLSVVWFVKAGCSSWGRGIGIWHEQNPPALKVPRRGSLAVDATGQICQTGTGAWDGSYFACGGKMPQSLVAVRTFIFYCRKCFFYCRRWLLFLRGRCSISRPNRLWR